MPVAVGTGGKTVAFRGELSANQFGGAEKDFIKINLDTASIDTDNSFVDGKFKPSVAGYYQASASVGQYCTPASTRTIAAIFKNGALDTMGSQVDAADTSHTSVTSDMFYINGTTDYLELYGYVVTSGTVGFNRENSTFLSAVLVSGGSASGDSIWTEEDGKAVYCLLYTSPSPRD